MTHETRKMDSLLKVEEAAMLMLAIFLNYTLPYPGWYFWALFLAPDIGFLGYIVNPRVGAVTYNLLHHKGLAVVCYLAGLYFSIPELQLTGLVLFGHSSFDRILGYGLKYPDSFHHTHLGMIGKKQA